MIVYAEECKSFVEDIHKKNQLEKYHSSNSTAKVDSCGIFHVAVFTTNQSS